MVGCFGLLNDPHPSHFPLDRIIERQCRLDICQLLRSGALIEGAEAQVKTTPKAGPPQHMRLQNFQPAQFSSLNAAAKFLLMVFASRLCGMSRCRALCGRGGNVGVVGDVSIWCCEIKSVAQNVSGFSISATIIGAKFHKWAALSA
jgi:hypothetical protein